MGKRRFVVSSDGEDDSPPRRNSIDDEKRSQMKRKKLLILDDDDEMEMVEAGLSKPSKENKNSKEKKIDEPKPHSGSESDGEEGVEAHPVGEVVRVSGKGKGRRSHYGSFEYDGLHYHLEDPVLLVPEEGEHKSYVAIIKDIAQTSGGALMIEVQWFYRPEEAEKNRGRSWQSNDARELFYSFHRDEVPAESVMHKCVVHFIPLNKQIPRRKQHPGFIVQKVYDTDLRKLFKLTDKDYEENNQHEINILVQKTIARLGDLPDLEPEDANVENDDHIKSKRLLRKKNASPLDVTRVEDEGPDRTPSIQMETPGSASEYYAILLSFKALLGETKRDGWLEKLLQSIQFACTLAQSKQNDVEEPDGNKNDVNESHNKSDALFIWPDAAVSAMAALEKAAHEMLSADSHKYTQKMRHLTNNLKGNVVLARRLLNKELEPAQILSMSPNELKEGLTAEELASRQPGESGHLHLQMTDATCKRCSQRQVALLSIFQARHGDRYQLECSNCGNTWYASRDDAIEMTIGGPKTVDTLKFEDVEKDLASSKEAMLEAISPAQENSGPLDKTFEEERDLVPDTSNVGEKELEAQKKAPKLPESTTVVGNVNWEQECSRSSEKKTLIHNIVKESMGGTEGERKAPKDNEIEGIENVLKSGLLKFTKTAPKPKTTQHSSVIFVRSQDHQKEDSDSDFSSDESFRRSMTDLMHDIEVAQETSKAVYLMLGTIAKRLPKIVRREEVDELKRDPQMTEAIKILKKTTFYIENLIRHKIMRNKEVMENVEPECGPKELRKKFLKVKWKVGDNDIFKMNKDGTSPPDDVGRRVEAPKSLKFRGLHDELFGDTGDSTPEDAEIAKPEKLEKESEQLKEPGVLKSIDVERSETFDVIRSVAEIENEKFEVVKKLVPPPTPTIQNADKIPIVPPSTIPSRGPKKNDKPPPPLKSKSTSSKHGPFEVIPLNMRTTLMDLDGDDSIGESIEEEVGVDGKMVHLDDEDDE